MSLQDPVIAVTSERVIAGGSGIVGVTALAGQCGVQLNLNGSTLVCMSNYSVAASFYASTPARLSYLNENLWPMKGTFYLGVGSATMTVDVVRFYK